MVNLKLNIKALKKDEDIIVGINEKIFDSLQHSTIKIDEKGISTNARTKDDSSIKYRDSLVISALAFNMLLLIIDKWNSLDSECKKFIENNLELIANYMKGGK